MSAREYRYYSSIQHTHRRHVGLLLLLRRTRGLKPRGVAMTLTPNRLVLIQAGNVVEARGIQIVRECSCKARHVVSLMSCVGRVLLLRGGGFLFHPPLIIQRLFEHLLLVPLRQWVMRELE